MSSVQISIAPPDLRTADARIVAVSKYLRNSPIVKARPALLNGQRQDFFRMKRAVRALLAPEYEKARQKNQFLPEVKTPQQARSILEQLPHQRMAFNVKKLETQKALSSGMKPQSGVPCVVINPQQTFGDDEYFIWFYNPVPITTYLMGFGILALVLAICLFPLWPMRMRRLSWYVSVAALGFLAFLLVVSVIRLALFLITYFTVKPGIWLFPNLYADLGVIESFKPLWAWQGQRTLPKKPKLKKRHAPKPSAAEQEKLNLPLDQMLAGAGAQRTAGEQPGGQAKPMQMPFGPGMPPGATPGPPGNPQQQPDPQRLMLQQVMKAAAIKSAQRVQQIVQTNGPKPPEELKAMQQAFMKEELQTIATQFRAAQASQTAANQM